VTNRMVTIRTINLKDTNVFLLPCNDGYLLIDTSRPGTYPQFLGAIKDLGIAVGDIRYLFLTHHHWDHVGFINELVNDPKSDVKVVLHEKELPFLSHERMSNLRGRNRGLKLVLWYVHNVMKTCYEPYFPKSGFNLTYSRNRRFFCWRCGHEKEKVVSIVSRP
jgi:glyoxylase-like metal-dependent hydrolase (beta-lactamase superfamily II)